ncbi:MAG: DUF2380 domain-containing protein [Methylocystis sp.]
MTLAGALFGAICIQGVRAEPAPSSAPISIAVLDFDYADSSGEPRDQTEEHRLRTREFVARLRADLSANARYRVVSIECPEPPCTARALAPDEVIAAAKRAGARLILYGGVHKMSTLVQWASVELVDVEANKLLDDRFLTFRGDSDEAWRRAEAFVVEKMKDRDYDR